MKKAIVLPFVFAFCLSLLTGCGGGVDPDAMLAEATDNNVKRLSRMYTVFQMRNSLIGPGDEEELRQFILSHSSARLARIGIDRDNLDQIFFSERDGKKLIVRYGVELESSERSIPVVFEVEGQNGVRYVGFSNDYATEVSDDAKYERLMSGAEDNKVIEVVDESSA